MNMGNKIRTLRRRKGVSQEVLAQVMGVSFQAVSKWETGAAMPDVAAIPAIASYFGVSTDELFDFNVMEQEKQVQAICDAAAACRDDDPAEAERILREGLRQYPGNEVILNNLLYVINTPDRREEAVTVCKSILEVARYDDVKYGVLRILAGIYHDMGQQELVKATLAQIPEIYFSRLELNAKLLAGQEALDSALLQIRHSRLDLLEMLARAAELCYQQEDVQQANRLTALHDDLAALFRQHADALPDA